MRHYLIVLLLPFATPLAAFADDPGFVSKPAKDAAKAYDRDVDAARKAYDDAVEKARKEYEQQVAVAQKSYTVELVEAAKSVAQKGDLDEVTRINAEVKRVEAMEPGATLDLIEAARKKVAGTRWTWGRNNVELCPDGSAEVSNGQRGQWVMIGESECIVKVSKGWLYVFKFDHEFQSMTAFAHTETSKNTTHDKRLK